ncbi:MAG: hypothetical protein JKY37_24000 [Nannocystaceae bacterium]|nr:hypothetical protein [Nannocystaceae bacterium]
MRSVIGMPSPLKTRRLALVVLCGFAACKTSEAGPAEAAPQEISAATEPGVGTATNSAEHAPSVEHRGLAALTQEAVAAVQAQPRELFSLVPFGATSVIQAHPKVLYGIEGFSRAVAFVADQGDSSVPPALAAMATCGLEVAQVESITVAVDEHDDKEVVVRGPSFGDPDKWRCVATELGNAGKTPDFEIKQVAGTTVLHSDELRGRFVDDDTFVLFDRGWEDEVNARLEGKETKGVLDAPLADVIARVKTDEALWFAMILSPEQQGELKDSPMSTMTASWAALSVGDELAVTVAGLTPSDADAETARKTAVEQWESVKGMISMLGMPAALASKVEIKAAGDVVSVHLSATFDEVETMAAAIGRL